MSDDSRHPCEGQLSQDGGFEGVLKPGGRMRGAAGGDTYEVSFVFQVLASQFPLKPHSLNLNPSN